MKPVTIGHDRRRSREQALEIRARAAVGRGEVDAGVRERVVGDEEIAGVDECRAVQAIEIGRDDEGRQPLAEAGGHVERPQRTMAQQVDPLQRAAQFGEQRIDQHARPRRPSADQVHHRRAMTLGDLVEQLVVAVIRLLGETGAFEQMIGHTLKRRDDDNHRFAPVRLEHDAADAADRRRRRQGRAAELEYLH